MVLDIKRFKRYRQNLFVNGNDVYSYSTKVAEIKGNELHKVNWSVGGMTASRTTSRHINYVANELNLKLIEA